MTPTLAVFRGSPETGVYVWSPFVTKLEARLRFGGLPYQASAGSPRSAPKGKIPYIEIDEGGTKHSVGDSTLIIRHLVENGKLADLNASISPSQRAHDAAVRALLEDRIYFYGTREKWWDNYATMRPGVLGSIPWPVQVLVGLLAYRGVSSTLYGQGTGRYSDEEVASLKAEAWENVDALLAEAKRTRRDQGGPFWILGGDEPTEADATMFGFVVSALVCDAGPTTAKIVRGHSAVVEYAERIHERFFPDYQRWN